MTTPDDTGLLISVLKLCRVEPTEQVAVLTAGSDHQPMADLYLSALAALEVDAFQLNLAQRTTPSGAPLKRTALTGNEAAVEVLKQCDMVIDLLGLLWSPEQRAIQDAGTRILMSREPVSVISRMFPTPELRRRVEAGVRRLAAAQEMRITSPAGTDVVYRIGRYPAIGQYGYTDEPGRWDNLPGGFLYTGAYEDGVDGQVVVNAGDMVLPFKRYVGSPIRLKIERGFVVAIEGGSVDGELLRSYMAEWNDPRAYAVSHIGWGMDPKGRWDFLLTSPRPAETTGTDSRSFLGNVLFSTGPNNELGGTNDTPCHLDIPLKGCSVFLDGDPVVVDGDVIPEDLRVS